MMLIGAEASFRKACREQPADPATTTMGSNKLNKRRQSSSGPDAHIVSRHPSRNELSMYDTDLNGSKGRDKPPPGYFVPPFQHPTHHASSMALTSMPAYHHPHGYTLMVPPGVPYHPRHPGQQNPMVANQATAYSYARRTALPQPKKLYDANENQEKEAGRKVDDEKNSSKVSPKKPPMNALDGASLLLEAARVQQERQDRQKAATEKEIKHPESPYTVSSSDTTVPSLMNEEQENQQQGYTYAPTHPAMVLPYRHHPYHPHLPPPPPPGYLPHQHTSMQLQKTNVGTIGPKKVGKVSCAAIKAKHQRRGPWTEKEDVILRAVVAKMGALRWSRIAEHLPGREGKHCRNRWYHHLSPCVNKKSWTLQEDYIILQMHQAYGNRWSVIARQLEGRTDNAVKNRFNASMRSKIEAYLLCSRGNHEAQDDQGKYHYGEDLEGCLWAIRGPPDTEAAFRMTLGTKRLTNSYFQSVREWSEKWKRENAVQIFEYKKALKLLQAPTSFNQHLLKPIQLSFNKG